MIYYMSNNLYNKKDIEFLKASKLELFMPGS